MNYINDIPEKIANHLADKNEEVIWSFHKKIRFRIIGIIISLVFIVLLTALILRLLPVNSGIWVGSFNIAIFALFFLAQFFIYLITVKTERYIVTNERIIICKNERLKKCTSFYYKDIFRIIKKERLGTTSIHFETRTLVDKKGKFEEIPSFKRIKISESDYANINDAWLKKSRHNEVNTLFKKAADKYGLAFEGLHPFGDQILKINGSYNGLYIDLKMDKIYNLQKMTINIKCPNPYHRFLAIKREKDKDKMKKMFGMQDLIIGNFLLDEKYIFQSNDPAFLSFVLSGEIQAKMLVGGQLSGNLSFGEKKTRQIKDTRNSLEILDDQLIIENLKQTEIEPNKTSDLEYLFDEFKYQQYYSVRIIEQAIANFETVVHIALRVQEYGKE